MTSPQPIIEGPRPRFWFPQWSEIRTDTAGFLLNPEHEFLRHANPDATTLDAVRKIPCVVLRGEPGQGKSTSLREEEQTLRGAGVSVRFIDLAEIGSPEDILRLVFQGPEWDRWRGGHQLTLMLDSFDECRLSVTNTAHILLRELRTLPSRERLTLRIASRAGFWPEMFASGLNRLWPDGALILDLAPFRRVDAETVVRQLGVAEPEKFFEAVSAADAGPLAISPISLQLLVRLYKRGLGLPTQRRDLYEQGCIGMCTEQNESRRAAEKTGVLSPAQRLVVASRIAAVSLFSGRLGIWLGAETELPGDRWLTIMDVVGGVEPANGAMLEVTVQAVREVLSETALFTPVGTELLRWAHRTIQEFLAAKFVLNHDLPPEQLASLLRHPARVDRVVPQLRGVATWLGHRRDVLQMLFTGDPQALFGVELESAEDRRNAVNAILAAARGIEISDFHLTPHQYHRLNYSGIDMQLRPAILDKTANVLVRRVAIDIAEQCCQDQVEDALVTVLTDREDDVQIRSNAAYALRKNLTPATRNTLHSLLATDLKEDAEDDLLGHSLWASWPRLLDAPDLFAKLTPPKRPNYHGRYSSFLLKELLVELADNDLPVALAWARDLPSSSTRAFVFGTLCDRILRRAWSHLGVPAVRDGVAALIWNRIQKHHRSVGNQYSEVENDPFAENDDGRRLLLQSLIRLVADPSRVGQITSFHPQLVHVRDLNWLVDRLDEETVPATRALIVELINRYWHRSWPDSANVILSAVQRHVDLEERLAPALRPVTVASPEVDRLRAAHREELEFEEQANSPDVLIPSVGDRIAPLLERFAQGDHDIWCELIDVLLVDIRGLALPVWDITRVPGWESLVDEGRRGVCNAALAFLLGRSSRQDEWFECGRFLGPVAVAGVRAFFLLRAAEPARFNSLSADVWERWLPALLAAPVAGDDETSQALQEILAVAYQRRPDAFLAWLRQYVLRDNGRRSTVQPVGRERERGEPRVIEGMTDAPWKVSVCWDDRVAAVFRSLLLDSQINDTVYQNLLDALLRRADAETICIAADLARTEPAPAGQEQKRRATLLALCVHVPSRGMPLLVAMETTSRDLVTSVLRAFSDRFPPHGNESLCELLSEEQVADLYRLSLRLYPSTSSPPEAEGDVRVGFTPQDFRHGLTRALAARGTFAAVNALGELASHATDSIDIQFIRREAEQRALAETWIAPLPCQVLGLTRTTTSRIVRSNDELLLVLVESLSRYGNELQGETPQNFTLWDEVHSGTGPTVFRPKIEERFSDALKVHLERDLQPKGVISQREVVIRSKLGTAGAPGERTDIHVTATSPRNGRGGGGEGDHRGERVLEQRSSGGDGNTTPGSLSSGQRLPARTVCRRVVPVSSVGSP